MVFSNFTFIGFAGATAFVFLLLILLILVFEIVMFVDVIRNEFISSDRRLLWLVGMLLVHPFVALAYYFTDYQKNA